MFDDNHSRIVGITIVVFSISLFSVLGLGYIHAAEIIQNINYYILIGSFFGLIAETCGVIMIQTIGDMIFPNGFTKSHKSNGAEK